MNRHARTLIAAIAVALVLPAAAGAQSLYARDGTYLGEMNGNRYDQNSVSNPYGRYGSRYSPNSINNEYGRYGNRYSPQCVGYRCDRY